MNGLNPNKKIFIIIPAWNEKERIVQVIANLKKHGYDRIVVVDDSSCDNTGKLAKENGAIVLSHIINRGQGAALQTGNTYAVKNGADIIVHFDADGQMRPEDISKMIEPIINGKAEITLGSRFLGQTKNIPFTKRYILLPVSRLINYLFTGLWLSDVHNGFRALSKEACLKINIKQDEFSHATEIIEQIKINNLRYEEVPVTIIYHEYGMNLFGAFRILKELLIGKLIR